MKQVLQHLRTGELEVAELPCPGERPGAVLIRTRRSLISAGTERMLVEFSQANLLQKARQQPERVKQVLDKMRTDGIMPTLEAVFSKLDQPLPLGYCNVGEVLGPRDGRTTAGESNSELRTRNSELSPETRNPKPDTPGTGGLEDRRTGGPGEGPRDGGTAGLRDGKTAAGESKSELRTRNSELTPAPHDVECRMPNVECRMPKLTPGPDTRNLKPDTCFPFRPGDRVVSNGPHAEVVCVPGNLVAKVPEGVTDDQAAFTVLGAIALQGIRLASPTLGETFAVFGLGVIGLLTVQLLRASGCSVIGVDLNPERLKLAAEFGAQTVDVSAGGDPVAAAMAATRGVGIDGALITASAKSDAIVHQAAQACRKRGRIVLVGVVGLNLQRSDFYEKELSFQVSCSYGPGRYDDSYEQKGQDYPISYVRWTEQRNFEAVLNALASGALNVDPLITNRFALADAPKAYAAIQEKPDVLGVLLEYETEPDMSPRIQVTPRSVRTPHAGAVRVGVIGAGAFSTRVLLPALAQTKADLKVVADINPAAARHAAAKHGVGEAVTDHKLVVNDPDIDVVFIAVGHHLHAQFACQALAAGKHTVVEKPLALNEGELERIVAVYEGTGGLGDRGTAGLQDGGTTAGEPNSELRTLNSELSPETRHPTPEPPGTGGLENRRTGGPEAGDRGTTAGEPNSELRTLNSELSPETRHLTPDTLPSPLLMVGFNRRFSPHTVKIRELLTGRSEPLCMTMTVNAGAIPPDHWTQDPERGGGRVIGEGCHFIDLMVHLAGSPVISVASAMIGGGAAVCDDKTAILLTFADGSIGTINYFANGSKSYPKELLDVFSDGRVIRLENFRRTTAYGFKGFGTFKTRSQDKGHEAAVAAVIDSIAKGTPAPIPVEELINVTQASFAAVTAAREGRVIQIGARSR